MKNSFACYVLLVLCVDAAFAQFIGPPQNNFDQQRILTPQQQGLILSDIRQHQHRFNSPQPSFAPTQFSRQQFSQQQFPQQTFQQNAFQNTQVAPTGQALPNQSFQPTAATSQGNRQIIQHHTQTSFTPNFNQPIQQQNPAPTFATNQQIDPEKQKQRIKELKEKQAIIDKHNQFVEKQYEKALKKAQTDHTEFIENQNEQKRKLYQTLFKTSNGYNTLRYHQTNPRFIYPEEADLFKLAVQKYYEEHPTSTTTTTTTTTPKPTTTTQKPRPTTPRSIKERELEDSEIFLSNENSRLFGQIKLATQNKESAASNDKITFLPTAIPTRNSVQSIQSLEDLTILQKQYKNQQIKKDDLLAQLRLAIGENAEDELSKNITSREISLPNGQRVEIIRTTDPKLIPGAKPLDLSSLGIDKPQSTTAKPPKAILEELTRGVLPPGANFELLREGNAGLETIGGLPQNLPNQKKVTFVLLEEQNDGSFKVQGVKGNAKDKSEVDVDSILKKIKDGEIKLPPNTKIQDVSSTETPTTTTTTSTTPATSTTTTSTTTTPKPVYSSTTVGPLSISIQPNSIPPYFDDDLVSTPILQTSFGTQYISSSTPSLSSTTFFPTTNEIRSSTTTRSISASPKNLEFDSLRLSPSSSNDLVRQASTAATLNQNSLFSSPLPTNPTYPSSSAISIFQNPSSVLPVVSTTTEQPIVLELPDVLKKNGLFAMARFLRQSGLDTILNETGPYTIFVPTDKAFRTLLVQLGGPEKAEEKFKENPRLLSGLLLHHVIPGAFKIDTLQDEMTGVSLAGTQLRVNQYNMHDMEWNDIKITTINGAKVMDDKKDIEIPQGIAHSIDRVMFPLPVGDLVQTLQSDRERRFTNFLRALFASGLAETLQGTKTFTLFAPTDKAFTGLTSEELTRTVSDRTLARELVMRHLTPGTLYTNGMRYYQIRDSLEANRQITLSKSSGRIKVNNNSIVTQNIPSTNGVIHALDTLL